MCVRMFLFLEDCMLKLKRLVNYFILWRNDHLSWNDHADGGICTRFMAEKSVQWE